MLILCLDKSVFEVCGGSFLECDKWRVSQRICMFLVFNDTIASLQQDMKNMIKFGVAT